MICGSIYAYAYVSAISVPSFHNAVCADFIPSVFQSFLPIMSSTHDQLLNLLLLQLPALLINLLANLLDPRQVRRCALNLTVLIVPFIFFYPLLIKSHSWMCIMIFLGLFLFFAFSCILIVCFFIFFALVSDISEQPTGPEPGPSPVAAPVGKPVGKPTGPTPGKSMWTKYYISICVFIHSLRCAPHHRFTFLVLFLPTTWRSARSNTQPWSKPYFHPYHCTHLSFLSCRRSTPTWPSTAWARPTHPTASARPCPWACGGACGDPGSHGTGDNHASTQSTLSIHPTYAPN